MNKFLDSTGLSHFWTKAKDFIKSKYVAIGDDITVGKTKITSTGVTVGTASVNDDNVTVGHTIVGDDTITMADTLVGTSGEVQFSTDIEVNKTTIRNKTAGTQSVITPDNITTPKIVKTGGTASQVLLADGSVATFNAKNGIPKLDENGRIPLNQLGNLDTTLFEVVETLPLRAAVIKKNRIYLVKSEESEGMNIYAEFVYTGDLSTNNVDPNKWEKLGEYKSDVDLTPYSKKTETLKSFEAHPSTAGVDFVGQDATNNNCLSFTVSNATQSENGTMAASDKKALDTLTARYPLTISKFTVTPSLVEVGQAADVTCAWDYTNTDFHPVTAQKLASNLGEETQTASARTYKYTGFAGLTTAGTKNITLTANGSLKKEATITYHYPSYIGVVESNITVDNITVSDITTKTKSVEWGKGKTATLAQSNQKIVYAYPSSYGDLTSIKDGNGFEGFAGYTKLMKLPTINGKSYNVYVQNLPATASSTYTFA